MRSLFTGNRGSIYLDWTVQVVVNDSKEAARVIVAPNKKAHSIPRASEINPAIDGASADTTIDAPKTRETVVA